MNFADQGSYRRLLNASLMVCLLASVPAMAQPTKPVNPNATPEARALLRLFETVYGKKVLSGQHEEFARDKETQYIKSQTGKEPAVRGFDFIFYTDENNYGDETGNAINWHKRGGIVTFQWHWYAPMNGHAFGTKETSFDVSKAVTSGTAENTAIKKDMEEVAVQLKRLSDAKVPVLFRPLHEAEGKWFWWGAKEAEPCKKLWKMLYDYYTYECKFNNILWVWNQNTNPDFTWYPGDSVVDILSTDIYKTPLTYGSWIEDFSKLRDFIKGKKFIALTENGPIPDPDNCIKDKADWLWFATWWGDFISTGYVSTTELKKIYNHPYVITLDEMPEVWASVGIKIGDAKHDAHSPAYRPRVLAHRAGFAVPVVLKKAGDARLTVFDPAGRTIREIVYRNLPAGVTEVKWDGRDGRGAGVQPGAYIFTVTGAGATVSTGSALCVSRP